MSTLTVTAKGQVTLRKDVLQHLRVRPGERLELEKLPNGRVQVRAARPTGRIEDVFGMLRRETGPTLAPNKSLKLRPWGSRLTVERCNALIIAGIMSRITEDLLKTIRSGAEFRTPTTKRGAPKPGMFFRRWLADPLQMGSVVPSSRALCDPLVSPVRSRAADEIVLELGAGTGVVGRGAAALGVPGDRLFVVENGPA